MPFWRCFYHLVWTTHKRQPLISAQIEPVLFRVVETKSTEMGCQVLAVNAVPDHIHVAVTIPPSIAIAQWMKRVKGASSYEINGLFPNTEARFRWQRGYGVLTFGAVKLQMVVDYIAHQKEHHASQQIEAYMERADDGE
jgi:putative transposase